MKIAILYICTGKYHLFWSSFYNSAEKYFLSSHEKTYFVFTDTIKIENQNNENVVKIHQEKLGWPYDTLMRFKLFESIKNELIKFDYIFFLNANMLFLDHVNDEILPLPEESNLLGVVHPFFTWVENNKDFPYERNKKSLACIPFGKGNYYFMGGFNGGSAKAYLELISELNYRINEDLKKNIIAKWHDESHLNNYFLNKSIKRLSPIYGCPEGMEDKFRHPKIIILDKHKFGGHDFLRETKNSKPSKAPQKVTLLKKSYYFIKKLLPGYVFL